VALLSRLGLVGKVKLVVSRGAGETEFNATVQACRSGRADRSGGFCLAKRGIPGFADLRGRK
jgi:hypothetical protein